MADHLQTARPHVDLQEAVSEMSGLNNCGLVGLEKESLNQLFETLADWNIVLNEISHDLEPMP